jgi:deferrochelatase/peroxidase EfeB
MRAPSRRLTFADRGPGYSYRADDPPPSVFGAHQPGVATPLLDHLVLASFDAENASPDLLASWSDEAERLMTAHHTGSSPAGALTITFGFGPGIFETELRDRRPAALRPLPPFDGDALDPAMCGGDLCIQACAEEGAAAAEAVRRLTAVAAGVGAPRWTQTGHLRRNRGDAPRGRPRDPLGFKDGTHNPRRGRDLDRHIWAGAGERTWMAGGSYLVVRRIEVDRKAWERLEEPAQERVIGRHKSTGAPLGGRAEFDPLRFDALPGDSHVRLTAPRMNEGAIMLRRSYTYGDREGLVFLAYGRDPWRQFVPMQRRLAEHDALSEFTTHVGSALFAIPPGARAHGFIGAGLRGS